MRGAFDTQRAVVATGIGVVARFPGILCVARCADPGPVRHLLGLCASIAGPEPGHALARGLATWLSGPDAPGPTLRFGTLAAAGEQLAVFLVGAVDAWIEGRSDSMLSGAYASVGTDRLMALPTAPVALSVGELHLPADVDDVHDLRAGVVEGAGVVLHPAGAPGAGTLGTAPGVAAVWEATTQRGAVGDTVAFDAPPAEVVRAPIVALSGAANPVPPRSSAPGDHDWFAARPGSGGKPAPAPGGGRNGAGASNGPRPSAPPWTSPQAPAGVATHDPLGRHAFFPVPGRPGGADEQPVGSAGDDRPADVVPYPAPDPEVTGSVAPGGFGSDPDGAEVGQAPPGTNGHHPAGAGAGERRPDPRSVPSGLAAADASGPDASGPDASGPDAAGPDASGPDAAGPDASGPGEADPGMYGPGETNPERYGPSGIDPRAYRPGRIDPEHDVSAAVHGPADHGPADRGPADHGPAEYGPAGEYGPAKYGPADHGPADYGPADYGPADYGPADYGPAEYGPAGDHGAAESGAADDDPEETGPGETGTGRSRAGDDGAGETVAGPVVASERNGIAPVVAAPLPTATGEVPIAFPTTRPRPAPGDQDVGAPAGTAASPAPVDGGPQVRGYVCEQGHLNDPRSPFCGRCGDPIDGRTSGLVTGPRPALGRLVFDDGVTYTVDDGYLVGRMPEADDRVNDGALRPIIIEDRTGSVSRVHAEIAVSGWDVMLLDAGSRNGTFVAGPEEAGWSPLAPRRGRRLLPGTRVRLGGRTFVFESAAGGR